MINPISYFNIIKSSVASENGWKAFLLIYFVFLISICFYETYVMWAPIEGPIGNSNTTVTFSPADQKTLDIYVKKNISGQILLEQHNNTEKDTNGTVVTFIQTYLTNNMKETVTTTNSSKSSLDREITLLKIAVLFGILGAAIHGLTSLVMWNSTKKLRKSYFLWFFTKPFIGGALALIVYALLRASLLSGISSGVGMISQQGFVNIYGVAGLSALIGLMTGQMTQKLRDVFDAVFGIKKENVHKGDVEQDNNIIVNPSVLNLSKNEESGVIVLIKDNNGEPLKQTKVFFRIIDTDKLTLLDSDIKLTDDNGMTFLKVKGTSEGKTEIILYCKISDKNSLESVKVKISNNLNVRDPAPPVAPPADKKEPPKATDDKIKPAAPPVATDDKKEPLDSTDK
ncbi:MAG: hypothetical protein ABJB76_04395 [Candidatus Nitrosocosmicus sp.]